ncbi:hypothetical protein LJB78_00630 [Bacteroidales bacterium OttesenSCG-928-J16]|nr:hypothetical protein [Bacteroidales bacterium OttesenSCG-928-J16]
MKKKVIIIGGCILSLCICIRLFYHKANQDYCKKFHRIEDINYLRYEDLYCSQNVFNIINSVEDLFAMMLQEDADSIGIRYFFCQDPMSSKDELLLFIPLYNRMQKRESFLLLSAGIDGKQNNILKETDTLYIDDWWNYITTYNYEELMQQSSLITLPRVPEFNMRHYLFGKKDYIIIWGKNCPIE